MTIDQVLRKIARQIMTLDEETLTALLPRYRDQMLDFSPTKQWEESMLIYYIINGLRVKNIQFDEKLKDYMTVGPKGGKNGPHIRPRLRLIKTETDPASGGESD